MSLVRMIARPTLAAIFVVGGYKTFRNPVGATKTATPLLESWAQKAGLDADPEQLVRANAATMVAGGALLALGIAPRLAAAVLAATMIPTTLAAHSFWKVEDPQARGLQQIQFLKNLSTIGGLLLAVAGPERNRDDRQD